MIDIHCHILWGVDDGASDLEESVQMARVAVEEGIKTIVATPHFTNDLMVKIDVVRRKVQELQATLDELGIPLTLRAGNEIRLESADFVYRYAEQGTFGYLDAERRYVLVEEPWGGYLPESPDIVRWFVSRGTTPIITHPERHPFFRENPALLTALLELGAWTQVSADSLLGKNGDDAQAFAVQLLNEDRVHTLASDAHNIRRKPNLGEGFRRIREHAGDGKADAILERMSRI
ncbi:tyrosine-protein phosphatase [Paenibacillus chartarius]|uniref:Tyrosine-protein phosphatase n=1 Tax=Paenibacillus chartarius TaxID=747481 RepID=A0ABV6DEU0_9BACL